MRAIAAIFLTLHALLPPAASHAQAPAAYRPLPRLDIRVFRCSPSPGHQVLASAADVAKALERFSVHCRDPGFTALKDAFLASLATAGLRWEAEALVVVGDWYGTGMAKARLALRQSRPGVVDAAIVWTVPPPPVTPDTAVFRSAFAVHKSSVTTVSVTGKDGKPVLLPVDR